MLYKQRQQREEVFCTPFAYAESNILPSLTEFLPLSICTMLNPYPNSNNLLYIMTILTITLLLVIPPHLYYHLVHQCFAWHKVHHSSLNDTGYFWPLKTCEEASYHQKKIQRHMCQSQGIVPVRHRRRLKKMGNENRVSHHKRLIKILTIIKMSTIIKMLS